MGSFSRRSLCAFVLLVGLTGACSGGDGNGDAAVRTTTTAPAEFSFTVTGTEVHAMSPEPPAFPDDVSGAVRTSLDTWLGAAIVGPLRTGKPPSGLDAVFTAPALGKVTATGADRSAMVEQGAPLTGEVEQDRANARLTALTGPDGKVELVTAQIDVAHAVTSGDGFVDIVRGGEVVLVPDAGTWRIDAFDVETKRDTRAP